MSIREPVPAPTAAPFTVIAATAPPKSPVGALVPSAVVRIAAESAEIWTMPPSRLTPESWETAVELRAVLVVDTE